MKRFYATVTNPWFLIGIGLSDIALGLTQLALEKRRRRAWDEAAREESEKTDAESEGAKS